MKGSEMATSVAAVRDSRERRRRERMRRQEHEPGNAAGGRRSDRASSFFNAFFLSLTPIASSAFPSSFRSIVPCTHKWWKDIEIVVKEHRKAVKGH